MLQTSLFDTIAAAVNPNSANIIFASIAAATMPAPATQQTPPPPVEPKPEPITFNNLNELLNHCSKVGTQELNYSQYLHMRSEIMAQELKIKSILNAMTIPELKKYVHTWHSNPKKSELIDKGVSSIIAYFLCNKSVSYSPFDGETYEGAKAKVLQSITEQDYNKYVIEQDAERAEKAAKRAATEAAILNPITLDDYIKFIKVKGETALTIEQRAIVDELLTEKRRTERANKEQVNNVVKAVEVTEGLQMEIKTSHHAKKCIPLWVVVLSTRIDGNQFAELKDRAHKLGGYYSSFRGSGAIPGFTFESLQSAEMFTNVISGNVDTTELKEQTEEERQQERAETLEEKAQRIADTANESLNRDRKDNTHRRAAQAQNAEREALQKLEFSQIMTEISNRMKEGNIKHLTKVNNITEVQTLLMLLSAAKWKHIHEKKIDVKTYGYTPSIETAQYVVFPYPNFWPENANRDIITVMNEPGKKMAAARMQKRIKAMVKDQNVYYCSSTQEIEDYETVFCDHSKYLDKYTRQRYAESLNRYKRIVRIGLLTPPELRAAIRELISIINSIGGATPEQKRMQEIREVERKFRGANIDGFFPTPTSLAIEIVNKAGIEEGNTILEPSAGLGHIADIINNTFGNSVKMDCIETHTGLSEALKVKGHNAENTDFLTITGRQYDRIVMNPPFENGQDIDHLQHAYTLLKPHGRIVCIMANNKRNNSSKSRQFLQWLNEVGGVMEENSDRAFMSSFRPTGVSTVTVVIDK